MSQDCVSRAMSAAFANNKLLAGLGAPEREALAPHLREREYSLGEVLYEHGDIVTDVHFLTAGIVSVLAVLRDGGAVETCAVGSEGMIGDGAAVTRQSHFGRALVQMQGSSARIEVGRLRDLMEQHPAVRDLMVRYTHSMLAESQQNSACNAVHRLEGRLAKWLLRCHDRADGDTLPMTQEFLSYMLGAQRTTVTEVARRLQFAGLIRYSRGRIEILDRPGLERASCECYAVISERRLDLGLPEFHKHGPA